MSSALKAILGVALVTTSLTAAYAQTAPLEAAPAPLEVQAVPVDPTSPIISADPAQNDATRAFERGYIGLYGGEIWMGMEGKDKDFLADRTTKLRGRGPIGGVVLGFNRGFAQDWLYGLEANAGFNTARLKKHNIPATILLTTGNTVPGTIDIKSRLSWTFGVTGRLGYKIAPNTAIFGRLGVAFTYAELAATVTTPFVGTPKERLGGNPRKAFVPSLVPGIDVEHSINDKWNLRVSTSYSLYIPGMDVTDSKLKKEEGLKNKTLVSLNETYVGAAFVYKLK